MASSDLIRDLTGSDRKMRVGVMAAGDGSSRRAGRAIVSSALMMTSDVFAVLLALIVSLYVGSHTAPATSGLRHIMTVAGISNSGGLGYLVWFVVTLLVVSWHYGLYGPIQLRTALHEQRMTAQACLTAGLLLSGGLYLTEGYHVSRSLVLFLVCFTAVILCARRLVARVITYREYERGVNTRNLVILGSNHISVALKEHISRRIHLGYTFRGFLKLPGCHDPSSVQDEVLGGVDQIRQIAKQYFIDELVIAEPCSVEQVISILEEAREIDMDVRVLPGYYESVTADAPIEYLGDFPVVALHRGHVPVFAMALKRVFDIALSLSALIAAAPIMIAMAIAIRMQDGGPIFYVSERVGKKATVFPCYKFRSMVLNADKIKAQLAEQNERAGILFKMKNDPRITRVGRFLRKYSLDELPQLFNVLQGDMSIVGPRPPIASEVAKYEIDHFRRLEVLPGLTGLWQVRARQDPSFERYIALDTAYVENWSFWLDLKIIVQTAGAVMRGTGA
ncbi:Undecaprenyl-phosphate galactosephosphotransferase [Acidisarcina polymorpha]|uniref:Undecaprenyl-phosphate galactosephosphotransferase n=1 Tax=Acidisarcina polymorpha TaxID=2211140 RepID=A0A2Z5G8A4_9BACT|nr:sugar transferase [Acidisarcina polymorpha]AXC15209.1 Undecaprenyl-phosphate galactosephosphotransferase [Acidisarcina polymorpha]